MRYDYLKKLVLFIISILAVFPSAGCGNAKDKPARPAPPPAVISASIDKSTANPGDIITFTLAGQYDSGVQMELPEIGDRFTGFRTVKSGVSGPTQEAGRITVARWYKLQAESAGSYVIDPVEVGYRLPSGEKQTAKTPRIFLEVQSLLAQDGGEDIRDIKPPLPVLPSFRFLLPVAVAAAAAAVIILLAKWILRRYRRKKSLELMRKPPHEEAMDALERLLMRRLVEQGRLREFCFEISGILRRYIEARFGVPAIDLTTEELLRRVDEQPDLFNGEVRPTLTEFLIGTDLVKFAKYHPPATEVEKIIKNTTDFITLTAPPEVGQNSKPDTVEKLREHVPV